MGNIFGISSVLFYFIENEQLKTYLEVQYISYSSEDKAEFYSLGSGLVGLVAKTQQGLIINNVKQSSVYNENVDMKSILPIYCIPLVYEGSLSDYGIYPILIFR
jgi:hypothetical protein